MEVNQLISSLLYYAEKHLDLNEDDKIYIQNQLIHIFEVDDYLETQINKKEIDNYDVPDVLTLAMKEHFLSKGKNEEEADIIITQVYGLLTPLPSAVNAKFNNLYKSDPIKATDYFYNLCIKNDYVKKSFIARNLLIQGEIDGHGLDLTINLSKPEKIIKMSVRKKKLNLRTIQSV